jgi:16S rRNA (guanine527-N7)-methyltransferase
MMEIDQQLQKGLEALKISADVAKLAEYLTLLTKWNQVYNLTAIRDVHSMVNMHIFDSLAILPWVNGTRIVDVGTGPGLPGIPLALANADLQVVLLDSNGKKIRFLQEAKRVLQLTNVEVVQNRVEIYRPAQGFDTVVSRAFSNLQQMVEWTKHLIAHRGIWLAMKGRQPNEELEKISHPYRIETYKVPGVEGERCCVLISS